MIPIHPLLSNNLRDSPLLLNLTEIDKEEKLKISRKLHQQFGHASSSRIIDLIKDSGTEDAELNGFIEDVERKCETCAKFKRPALKPIVGFALAKEFNEAVSMDLKDVEEHKVFHMIDNATRCSAGAVIPDKTKEVIVNEFFLHWIALFGCPGKLLSDNGGKFNS